MLSANSPAGASRRTDPVCLVVADGCLMSEIEEGRTRPVVAWTGQPLPLAAANHLHRPGVTLRDLSCPDPTGEERIPGVLGEGQPARSERLRRADAASARRGWFERDLFSPAGAVWPAPGRSGAARGWRLPMSSFASPLTGQLGC